MFSPMCPYYTSFNLQTAFLVWAHLNDHLSNSCLLTKWFFLNSTNYGSFNAARIDLQFFPTLFLTFFSFDFFCQKFYLWCQDFYPIYLEFYFSYQDNHFSVRKHFWCEFSSLRAILFPITPTLFLIFYRLYFLQF